MKNKYCKYWINLYAQVLSVNRNTSIQQRAAALKYLSTYNPNLVFKNVCLVSVSQPAVRTSNVYTTFYCQIVLNLMCKSYRMLQCLLSPSWTRQVDCFCRWWRNRSVAGWKGWRAQLPLKMLFPRSGAHCQIPYE